MGHHSCCNQQKVKRGLWSPEEDEKLIRYITNNGYGCWSEVPEKAGQFPWLFYLFLRIFYVVLFCTRQNNCEVDIHRYIFATMCLNNFVSVAGLQRCGKSCRLRWINYLRPDIRRGRFTPEEEKLIISLHSAVGNRFSFIINLHTLSYTPAYSFSFLVE